MITKTFDQDYVFENSGILFNVDNLYETQPPDYAEKLKLCHTKVWIDKFHDNYYTIILDESDLYWMKMAMVSGSLRNKFPHMFDDELDEICEKYKDQFKPGKWFVRTERVSLKYGVHGPGPYTCFRNVIESCVTSMPGHLCFKESAKSCTLYFMNWIDIDYDKEFRIFVYNNQITAISTQNWMSINKWLDNLPKERLVKKIVDYFTENISPKMQYLKSYVMDLALISKDENPYFIEPNPFGAQYSSGSALFHWIHDQNTLHDSTCIELRYVDKRCNK